MTGVITEKSRNTCKNKPFNHTTSQTYTYKDLYQLKTLTGNSSLYLYCSNNSVYQKNYSDHLGSAQTVTNHKGQIHERLEYTPYGELWIDWKNKDIDQGYATPYRFTGKELDQETGFYYYGARYLDPKTSRWLSSDPAMGEYVPSAPVSEEARKRNGSLPGMGGVFNYVNLHVYHYAGNNPVKYVDPDGKKITVQIHKVVKPWYHASIKITLDTDLLKEKFGHLNEFKNFDGEHRYLTIGAGSKLFKLFAEYNRPKDKLLNNKVESFDYNLKELEEVEKIEKLLEIIGIDGGKGKYKNNLPYALFPDKKINKNKHNSNSFFSGALNYAGLELPTLDYKEGLPGINKPISISE